MNKAVVGRSRHWSSRSRRRWLACGGGGGGGNVRVDPPPTTPPTPPPTTPPPTTTTPTQPAFDAHLTITHAGAARSAGLTGSGVRIGIVDSGVMRNHPALAGRVLANSTTSIRECNNLNVDDVVGHGTAVAELAAGAAVGTWPGGIAPGAQIVSARIIADTRPTDDGSGSGNEVNGALGLGRGPCGPDQPRREGHEQLLGRPVLDQPGGHRADRPGIPPLHPQPRRPGGVRHRQREQAEPVQHGGVAQPARPERHAAGGRSGARLAGGHRGRFATSRPSWRPTANACGVRDELLPGRARARRSSSIRHDTAGGTRAISWNYGTSFAAPLVSGAAALVWQKYPYFSNDLVRQTLLGTATDLGAPGVDATFGYGLLNVGKAVNGPGRFDWGDVTVNVAQSASGTVWSQQHQWRWRPDQAGRRHAGAVRCQHVTAA